jgi:hypothetical protein
MSEGHWDRHPSFRVKGFQAWGPDWKKSGVISYPDRSVYLKVINLKILPIRAYMVKVKWGFLIIWGNLS